MSLGAQGSIWAAVDVLDMSKSIYFHGFALFNPRFFDGFDQFIIKKSNDDQFLLHNSFIELC